MADGHVRWYILFRNYEQGLALHDLLDRHDIKNRIAPAPRAIQGKLSCGMSLLIEPEQLDAVRACIEENGAEYYDIVPLEGQIKSHRDKYC
ncbi:MAG: DUF3343 domain-containing protein [Oscillospiraceae bacterium]|nr:DUF3343 domain-containing protein [Oscillospiraceae bacterium]